MTHPFMRTLTLTCSLATAACCHPATTTLAPPPAKDPTSMPESWRTLPPVPACATAFAALRTGDFSAWNGLTGCTRRDAEDAFGPSEAFTGLLGPGRRHVVEGVGPMGVHVAYNGDHVVAVALAPTWTADRLAPLGPPDDESPSGDGIEHRQLTWAERGLIAHISQLDTALWIVVAFAPSPLDVVRTSSLFHLGIHERRIEP